MTDAADINIKVRKGRTFSEDYQLKTEVINGDPVVRDVTGASFAMQFRDVRGGATIDLQPVYFAVDLALGQFAFIATAAATDAMTSLSGSYEIQMTLSGVVTTEFEGVYTVVLPVVQ